MNISRKCYLLLFSIFAGKPNLMKPGKVYLLFFLLVIFNCPAQFDALLHKKYRDKVGAITNFYKENMPISYPEARKKSEELKSFAKKNKDISLELEAEIYLAYYAVFHNIGTEKEQVDEVLKVAERGKKEKIFDIEARALKVLREYYWYDKKNYEIGFEYGLKLDKILTKTNATDFPDLAEYYCIIGSGYYLFRDYQTAIKYYKKVLDIPENHFNWKSIWSAFNTLGIAYQKINKTDASNYYFKKAAASPFLSKDSLQYTISMGNIGYNLYRTGKFSEAEPLLRNDISNAEKHEDYGLASGSMITLADIYIYQGKINEAEELLKKSQSYIRKSGQKERYEYLYPVIGRLYNAKGMKETSIKYKDSAIIAANNNNNTFNGLTILRVQQKIDQQKMEQAERNKTIRTIFFLVSLAVIIAFSFLYYSYMKRIYKEKSKTKEAELNFSKEKLENANHVIRNFLKEIENKNRLIDQLKQMDYSAQNKEAIEEIKKTVILTDEDWENFREAFERINPEYINRLKHKIHNITPAEIRIVVLSKLNMSHKEIANILGISPQSSRVTWHRLKKKINLDESVSLHELAEEV